MHPAVAQTPYPDLTLQDVTWTEGTHHYAVTQRILSPSTPDLPVAISGTADAEFVSGTQVRLRPGFHAGGFTGNGRFRAYVNASLGPPGDVVIISPAPDGSEPYGSIVDNVIHVHKWENVEVGLRLPQEYQDAIDRFFRHYYPYNHPPYPPDDPNINVAVPGNVDPAHDLNPYADDSLQLVMTLTKPDGTQTMKWGFFMKEAKWESDDPNAKVAEHPNHPLYPYHVRFRFAPDQVGPWQFHISVRAPYTSTLGTAPLPDLLYTGYALACEPPLPDNKGHLMVNPVNRRLLQFEDGTPFFGLGTNMADNYHGNFNQSNDSVAFWYTFYKRDHDVMLNTMGELHQVGGNFLRMFLMRHLFAPEWVNLGVYDGYLTPMVCDLSESVLPNDWDCDRGWTTGYASNCQYQSWAFDQVLDRARNARLYIQLCIDPYVAGIAYEKFLSGAHAYTIHFLDRNRPAQGNPYNMRELFYAGGDTTDKSDRTVFYYWKRKYKYFMSRWGWSVNIPIIEPFNEIDQMLSYQDSDLGSSNPVPNCDMANDLHIAHRSVCRENRGQWTRDNELPYVISQWFTDIAQFVRGEQDPDDPVHSPLGEDKKLFLASFTDAKAANVEEWNPSSGPNLPHYQVFTNPEVDLIDVHRGQYPDLQNEANLVDWRSRDFVRHANSFWNTYPAPSAPLGQRKPFNQGESQHYTKFTIPNPANPNGPPLWSNEIEKIFHNYDVSFHNEIWAGAFSGKFATGTTWHWPRVFWWPDALPVPPDDESSLIFLAYHPSGHFSNQPGLSNYLDINGVAKEIKNRPLQHHFAPLAELLFQPSVVSLGILSDNFTPRTFFDNSPVNPNPLECYYLQNDFSTAIGWVHNRNASIAKSYYVRSGPLEHNFLGCTAPATASITLQGFFSAHPHYVTWFPTRTGATELPPDTEFPDTLMSTSSGDLTIDLSGYFNGIADNYLDTLHSDYAFIITPQPFVKSLTTVDGSAPSSPDWDFILYPNPASEHIWLRFSDEVGKAITMLDVAGRVAASYPQVAAQAAQLPTDRLAKGVYWVQVRSAGRQKVKKVIIH